MLPPPGTVLCRLAELDDPAGREFSFGRGPDALVMFVVRTGGAVFGYVNACPHTGGPLNWLGDRFLAPGGREIQCATHGARFRIEDGACLSGPCDGRALSPVAVRVDGGNVVVAES